MFILSAQIPKSMAKDDARVIAAAKRQDAGFSSKLKHLGGWLVRSTTLSFLRAPSSFVVTANLHLQAHDALRSKVGEANWRGYMAQLNSKVSLAGRTGVIVMVCVCCADAASAG